MKKLAKSISNAIRGLRYTYIHEHNFRIQLVFAIIVIVAAMFLDIQHSERIVLFLLIMLVLLLELLNSALEKFVDLLKPRLHTQVGIVKDIMAGMVLIAAVGSIIIGVIIFSPYLIEQFF